MEDLTQKIKTEISLNKRNRLNKTILGFFLFVVVGILLLKIIDGMLIDYGFGIDKLMKDNYLKYQGNDYNFIQDWSKNTNINTFHKNFWSDPDIVYLSKITKNMGSEIISGNKGNEWAIPALHAVVSRHPNTFWLLTQFTWITTIILILFLIFRLFKYESTVPRWLKWIMSQRTLSLITMYDMVVAIGFWAGLASSFQNSFIPGLEKLELIITIFVHGVIPFLLTVYSLTYLIKDEKASILKEMFVLKGILYPTIYIAYYVLVSAIWNDPYNISNLRYDFIGHIWKVPIVIIVLWILLGIMLLIHNLLLLKLNKKYDKKNDYEILRRRDLKISKLRRKTTRKIERRI